MEQEIWRWIPGYKGWYKASTLGRIKSVSRRIAPGGRGGLRLWPEKIMGGGREKNGRTKISLSKNGIKTKWRYHWILITFVGPPLAGQECRHYDGNPGNDRLSNIKWGTSKENREDGRRLGELAIGERSNTAVLTNALVKEIRKEFVLGSHKHGASAIARRLGLDRGAVYHAATRRTWRHLK